jgi:phytoene dehydrogenase-like protein
MYFSKFFPSICFFFQIYMFAEWYKPGCKLEYPINGSGSVIDALVRGIEKFRGRISLNSHVDNIVVENGRAVGVKLRSGQVLDKISFFFAYAIFLSKVAFTMTLLFAVHMCQKSCCKQCINVGHT